MIEWQREADAFRPNQKPVHAVYPLLASFAPSSGIVLDPFLGSGSTLWADKDMGLRAVGVEVEEDYCRRAAARLAPEVLFPFPADEPAQILPGQAAFGNETAGTSVGRAVDEGSGSRGRAEPPVPNGGRGRPSEVPE